MNRSTLSIGGVALAIALLFSACGQKSGNTVRTQLETAQAISKLEKEIDVRQSDMNTLLASYVQQGGKDLGTLVGQGLTPEQTRMLEQKLKNEEGIGYKDLLSDILGKQKAVEDMKVKVQDLERTLPSPVEVQKGQRHSDIALAYLTKEKGLDSNVAKKLVQQVNLMDELVPGFKVWNFYNDGVYGTFVTQGDASVSPYGVIQHAKQTLINDKNTAIAQRNTLATEKASLDLQVADLTAKRDQLTQDVSLLQAERQDLTKKVTDLQIYSDDLQSKMSSVFYRIGYRKGLVHDGFVKAPWYGRPQLAKFGESDYPQRLDLRTSDSITFTAVQAGVTEIRKVRLAPGATFKEGADYTVSITPDRHEAKIALLNKDKFRTERSMMVLVN